MSWIDKLKKLFSKQETVESVGKTVESVEKEVNNTDDSLIEWKTTVEAIKNHPLSQAKVINAQMLDSLTKVLESIDYKLDKLNELDEILELLKKGKGVLEEKGVEVPEINEAIEKVESIKDKEVMDILSQHEMLSAEELAARLGISRSTASYRLNRLVNAGLVEKIPQGRKVFFKIKTFNQ